MEGPGGTSGGNENEALTHFLAVSLVIANAPTSFFKVQNHVSAQLTMKTTSEPLSSTNRVLTWVSQDV